MDAQLHYDREAYAEILDHASRIALTYLTTMEAVPPGRTIADIPKPTLPEKGLGAKGTLQMFGERYAPLVAATSGPRYFGFVTGGSTPASVAGDWLVSAFDQNTCGSNDSVAPVLEKQTIDLLKQLFGLDDDYYGSFVTGATISNFVGLAQGRQWAGELLGKDIAEEGLTNIEVKVVSATPHSSIIKSMAMLGFGRRSMIKPATLPDREAVDIDSLEETLKLSDAPVIVVANAGTVNTVDFDDLAGIAELKKKYRFWLHVDAAFGGFAAISPKFEHLMKGINAADSITIDAHKWLNVPYDAAMQFTRHKHLQLKVFQNSAAYLGDPEKSPDFFHYTPENSRRWRGLPSWFTLMAYGKEGHREIVERNCTLAANLGEWIAQSKFFRLLAPVRMNVVCFTLADADVSAQDVQKFLSAVRNDGRVFFTPTNYKGTAGIRAAISNWQTELSDIELTCKVLEEVIGMVKVSRTS